MNGFNSLRLKKQLGIANRKLGSMEKIAAGGSIRLSLENGRKIEFNAAVHPQFDHGYAVTRYSVQGLTGDRVLPNADITAHPELLNTRFANVSVSRARLDAEICTNDMEMPGPRLGVDVGKTAAVDFSQSVGISVATDLGTGQSI